MQQHEPRRRRRAGKDLEEIKINKSLQSRYHQKFKIMLKKIMLKKIAIYGCLLAAGIACINILLGMTRIKSYHVAKKTMKRKIPANPIDYVNYNNHSLVRNWKCDGIPGYRNLCSSGSGDANNENISLLSLLTPPKDGRIMDWVPPASQKELDDLYLPVIEKIFKPFPSIRPDDLTHLMVGGKGVCEEPLRFKYEERQIYVDFDASKNPFNYDRSKVPFMSLRRFNPFFTLGVLNQRLKAPLDAFEGILCLGDAPPKGPGFSLVWNIQWEHDGVDEEKGIPFPLMEWTTNVETWDDTLNDVFTWRNHTWRSHQTNRSENKYRWENRYPHPVFRGGLRTCHPEFGDELARPIYNITRSSEFPDYGNCGRELLLQIARRCGTDCVDFDAGTFIPMKEQEQYKAIMHVEGHSGWANRLAVQLAMKNVIIRQFNMPFEEWYSAWLEPWVHYVPVDHLFTYLPYVNEWCRHHDESLLKISYNADRYAKTFLPVNSQLRFLELLLWEYSKRYQLGHNTTTNNNKDVDDKSEDRPPQHLEQRRWVHLDDLRRILEMYGVIN